MAAVVGGSLEGATTGARAPVALIKPVSPEAAAAQAAGGPSHEATASAAAPSHGSGDRAFAAVAKRGAASADSAQVTRAADGRTDARRPSAGGMSAGAGSDGDPLSSPPSPRAPAAFNFHTLASVAAAAQASPVPAGCAPGFEPDAPRSGPRPPRPRASGMVYRGVKGGDVAGTGAGAAAAAGRGDAAAENEGRARGLGLGLGGVVGGSPASGGQDAPVARPAMPLELLASASPAPRPTIQHDDDDDDDDGATSGPPSDLTDARGWGGREAGDGDESMGRPAVTQRRSPSGGRATAPRRRATTAGARGRATPTRSKRTRVRKAAIGRGAGKDGPTSPLLHPAAALQPGRGGGGAPGAASSTGGGASAAGALCPVCCQVRRRLSIFYQSQVQVCVACKDFFRRMVRKAREDLDVDADAITPSVLRDSSIATRFPRLIKCLDGGMDPQMVGVRQYTWRDPVRRALYADKDKARGSPTVGSPSRKGGAKAGGKGRGGKVNKAADHGSGAASRSAGRKKKRKAPPHPSTVTAGADDDVHGARHLHGRGAQLGRRPLPSPVPGADSEPGEGDEAMTATWDRAAAHNNRGRGRGGDSSSVGGGSVLDPALLTAVGRLTTGGSAGSTDGSSHGSGWGDDASSVASGVTPVSPRSHSPARHRGDAGSVASSSGASEASASSYSSYGSRGRRHTWRDSAGAGSAGRGAQRRTRPPVAPPASVGRLMLAPSGPPLDAGALLPFACEGVLVNHGVLERRSAGNAAGDGGPSRRCRVVGCSGTACAVGGSSHDAAAVAAAGFLCRYHGIEPGVGSGGKTFVAQVVLPRSGATKAAYVQACGSRHAVVWKWANEFERVRDGMCAKQCLWCSGSAGFARHVPPLARVGAFEGAAGGGWSKPVASSRRSGGGMWGSPVATNPHPLKREAHDATAAAADTAPGASSGARSAHGDAKVAPAPAFGPFAPAVLDSPPAKPRAADVPGAPGAGRSDSRREDDRGTPSHTAAWRSSAGAGDMHQPDGVARSGSGDSAVSVSGSEVSGMSASASVCADPIHVHLEVNGVVIGGLEVSGHHTLAQCREMILDELDHPPRHYLFEYKGAPVARKQEARRRAVAAHAGGGKLVLLPQPEAASPPLSVDPHRPAHARVAPGAGAAAVAAGSGIGKLPATSSAADARPAVHLPVSAQLGLGQPSPKKRQRVYEGWA